MNYSDIGNINALSNLLKESQEYSSTLNNDQSYLPPAITSNTTVTTKDDAKLKLNESIKTKNSNDIWDTDELPTEETLANFKDERPTPRYEFSYKQVVGSEDVFLGMSDKSPLSSDCTHLVVKVHFPKTTMKDLDLDVTNISIKAESKKFRLFTYLPVEVDSKNGKAKFDSKREVLEVSLPILKEF